MALTPRQRWFAAIVLPAVLGVVWLAPVSPAALSRADVALGAGEPVRAAMVYDRVAAWTPIQGVRKRALERGAAVYSAELNDPAAARMRLQSLLEEDLDPRTYAEIQARIGALLLRERRPIRAAKAYQKSVEADPDALDAARRMARAARALGDAGYHHKAMGLWSDLLAEHPPWRGRANLGRAELHLASGEVGAALPLYEDVVIHGTADEQAAARLGVSVCLEKLGDLDQAIAAIDGAELPEDVRQSRANALMARQLWLSH